MDSIKSKKNLSAKSNNHNGSSENKKKSRHRRNSSTSSSTSSETDLASKYSRKESRRYEKEKDYDSGEIEDDLEENEQDSVKTKESLKKSLHDKKSSHHRDNKNSSKIKKSNQDEKEKSLDDKHYKTKEKDSAQKSSKNDKYSDEPSVSSSNGEISLSIEETNKLRAKLGLKPLTVTDKPTESKTADGKTKKTYIDQDTNQEFEHVPAKNIAEIREQKDFKKKLEEQREKRKLLEKITSVKGIADRDDGSDSAQSWVQKLKEKEMAAKKAKTLEEMDEQFGVEDAASNQHSLIKSKTNINKYTSDNLAGLRVEHDETYFKEGQEVILTLKDKNILKGFGENIDVDDDEEADVLINVNIVDDEKAKKNIENKTKKADYKPFDDFDEDGNYRERNILEKYNEELEGEKKKSFKLGKSGTYDNSDQKFIDKLNDEFKARAIKLNVLNELKQETDYFTPQEMEKFKKPKKVRKVMRRNKVLKADDLLPLPNSIEHSRENRKPRHSDDQTITDNVKKEPIDNDTLDEKNQSRVNSLTGSILNHKVVSLKDIDFGFNDKEEGENDDSENDEDDDVDINKLKSEEFDDLKQMLDEENKVLDELHSVLNKTRQKITSSKLVSDKIAEIKQEVKEDKDENDGIAFESLNTIVENTYDENLDAKKSLTLDTMSEFCRNLGNTGPSSRHQRNREKIDELDGNDKVEDDEDDDANLDDLASKRKELNKSRKRQFSSDDDKSNKDEEMDIDTSTSKIESDNEETFGLLDEEPVIDRGLASALKLAVNKGYIEQEKTKQNARMKKESIEAINYTVEEKNYYDIDDKYNRNRDRYSGPLTDFKEKDNYKPDVKLDYIDEKGHSMNQKEAFRYLSHKFHGKGSGKKKTEKRNKKLKELELMNKMSSVDTPLNTVALLVEKQKKLQQPFVVLSAPKGKNDQVTLHKR